MEYRVEISRRARRDLAEIFEFINAYASIAARDWFNGLESTIANLKTYPRRGALTSEDKSARHLLYRSKPHIYRIIYEIDNANRLVNILHIRHGARGPFVP